MKRYIAALLLILCSFTPVDARPREYTGFAARYRENLMERVATKRGIPHEDCMVASTHERLRTWVEVTGLRSKERVRCIVVDIVAERDRKAVERRKIILEVQPRIALILCLSKREKPERCPIHYRRIE